MKQIINNDKHMHAHLTALCLGLPGWADTRKVKPIWILLKQETVSGSGISWAICKSAPRSRQITMPALHRSVFLQAGCPSCRPTNSVKETEGKPSIMRLQCKSTNLQPAVASPMPHWTHHDRYAGTQHCRAVHMYLPSAIHFPVKNYTTNGKTSTSYHFGGLPLNWPVPLTFPKLLKSHYFSQAFNICWFLCFS